MGEGTGEIDDGHTAWILVSCALVNFMTPGLAFFYGGLVRRNHVLSIIIQNYVYDTASLAPFRLVDGVAGAPPRRHRRDAIAATRPRAHT